MKKILILSICILMISPVRAQLDDKRMQRDLDISKNILSSLLKEEGNRLISDRRIEATYVEDFGVIIKIPPRGFVFNYSFPMPEPIPNPDVFIPHDFHFDSGSVYVFPDSKQKEKEIEEQMRVAEQAMKEAEKEMRKAEQEQRRVIQEMNKNRKEIIVNSYSHANQERNEEFEKKIEELIITFLADYADLIGQLKPDDKIMVTRQSGNQSFAMIWSDGRNQEEIRQAGGTGLSVTALKKDVSAFKAGKIDRKTFEERLEIKRGEKKERIADLDIFGTVFNQYFSPEYSKSFFCTSKPEYERLEGMGAIFHVLTYSSHEEVPGWDDSWVDQSGRKEKIESLYPQFIIDLKSFIVDYGRTIRSLNEDEKLVMKIEMTRCRDCDIPKTVEATISMKTLLDYDRQKISKEKALAEVMIKEIK